MGPSFLLKPRILGSGKYLLDFLRPDGNILRFYAKPEHRERENGRDVGAKRMRERGRGYRSGRSERHRREMKGKKVVREKNGEICKKRWSSEQRR